MTAREHDSSSKVLRLSCVGRSVRSTVLGASISALPLFAGCVVETGPLAYYEAGCLNSKDCEPGLRPDGMSVAGTCYTLTSGDTGESDSMCSGPCRLDADCLVDGVDGWCILQYAATSICFERCAADGDCDVGWRCEGVEDFETKDIVNACIPGW